MLVCLYALRGFTRPSYISGGGGVGVGVPGTQRLELVDLTKSTEKAEEADAAPPPPFYKAPQHLPALLAQEALLVRLAPFPLSLPSRLPLFKLAPPKWVTIPPGTRRGSGRGHLHQVGL